MYATVIDRAYTLSLQSSRCLHVLFKRTSVSFHDALVSERWFRYPDTYTVQLKKDQKIQDPLAGYKTARNEVQIDHLKKKLETGKTTSEQWCLEAPEEHFRTNCKAQVVGELFGGDVHWMHQLPIADKKSTVTSFSMPTGVFAQNFLFGR